MTIYSDYRSDRVGWFFGLTGWQLGVLAGAILPACWAMQQQAWGQALALTGAWLVVAVLVAVPVRGRSAMGWLLASTAHTVGGVAGWTRFRSLAAGGRCEDPDRPDLPGALRGLSIHDGPPQGPAMRRVAIIQDHATRTWAITAAVVHPGLGMSDVDERRRLGSGLAALLDVACSTDLVEEVLIIVRTVPDDGAERAVWVQVNTRPGCPGVSRRINDDLDRALGQASVRTETFVTFVVSESRLAKAAKQSGGGLDGRARVLYGVLAEMEGQLRGPVGMSGVTWLTSPELAVACRTGFAPGDRAGIVDAREQRRSTSRANDPDVNAPDVNDTAPDVNDTVPWAQAGPSGADPAARHYSHDAWSSVSCTMRLPANGAAMRALSPVLTPSGPAERRTLLVAFAVVTATRADRQSANSEWAADMASHLRTRAGVKPRAVQRANESKARGMDAKLATGRALVRPYAVCTVTVPRISAVADAGRRLEASVRRAGFAPLRLDLAQDTAFAATAVPLGISLTRAGQG